MNGFVTHRAKWIRFVYSCFDALSSTSLFRLGNGPGAMPTALRGDYWGKFDPVTDDTPQSRNPKRTRILKS
jgi:hypothetical protein